MGSTSDEAAPRSGLAAWGVVVGLGLLAAAATVLGNQLIVSRFADAARPHDLLFELLPYVGPAKWLTVVALVIGFGLFVFGVLRRNLSRTPAVLAPFALMYLLRALIMVLTPLAPAQGEGPFVFEVQQYGMFPSGHVGVAVLLAMLTPADRRWERRTQWAMVALMVAGMLLARGHYSIDIVGGMLLSYFVVHVWQSGRLFAPIVAATGR